MVCNSPSVARAAKHSEAAQKALAEFAEKNKQRAEAHKTVFRETITATFKRAGITDQTFPFDNGIQQQTEYESEFNVDKLTAVVESALKSLQAASGPAGPTVETAISPESIKSYVQVVESIGAALKSSGSTSGSFSFQMTRIGPGIFAFISAASANLTDTETFGTETVSCATYVYTFARSIQDIENTSGFMAARDAAAKIIILQTKTLVESARVASHSIIKLKEAQGGLLDKLIDGSLTSDAYEKLDDSFQGELERWEKRQDGRDAATNLVHQKHITHGHDSTQLLKIKTALGPPSQRGEFGVNDSDPTHSKKMDQLEKSKRRVQARVDVATLANYVTLVSNHSLAAKRKERNED